MTISQQLNADPNAAAPWNDAKLCNVRIVAVARFFSACFAPYQVCFSGVMRNSTRCSFEVHYFVLKSCVVWCGVYGLSRGIPGHRVHHAESWMLSPGVLQHHTHR